MRQILRPFIAAVLFGAAAVMLLAPMSTAAAQSAVQPVIKQIALTEKLVQNFINAQKEMSPVLGKIQGATAEQLPPAAAGRARSRCQDGMGSAASTNMTPWLIISRW